MRPMTEPIPEPVEELDTLPCQQPCRDAATAVDTRFDIAGLTDIGRVRRRNEDQFLIADMERHVTIRDASLADADVTPPPAVVQGSLLAVADGIGGHASGDVASAVVIDALVQHVTSRMPWLGDDRADARLLLDDLARALAACEHRLRQVAHRRHLESGRPGTTLTAAYVAWPSMFIVHAGDSRCYLLRNDELTQLTKDHTLAAALAESMPDDQTPASWTNVLSNAVGTGHQQVQAEVRRVRLYRGDTILLCSDGLTRHVSDTEIAHHIRVARSASHACQTLIAAANHAGGKDNITAVVARALWPTETTAGTSQSEH